MLQCFQGGVTLKFEINFVFDEESKSFWYQDLDSLLDDLKYDLFEFVRKAKFVTIRRCNL